jgi:hypothetical protein
MTRWLVVAVFCGAVLAPRPAGAQVILRAAVEGGTLVIEGRDLAHRRRPHVELGGQSLEVTSYSPERVTATMPADLAPGTYRLKLFARGERAVFDLSIGGVGPAGPQGPPGPESTTSAARRSSCGSGSTSRARARG